MTLTEEKQPTRTGAQGVKGKQRKWTLGILGRFIQTQRQMANLSLRQLHPVPP